MPECLSREQITIQDVSMKYGWFKGAMMDQYFTYSHFHTSILPSFMWTTFSVWITIHTLAAMTPFIHQSTLDSAVFFIGSQLCAECKIASFQQRKLNPPSEPGIELFLFKWTLLTSSPLYQQKSLFLDSDFTQSLYMKYGCSALDWSI